MELTPLAVAAYKSIMQNPKEHNLDFPSLDEIFDFLGGNIAKHECFDKYIQIVKKPIPKLIFYIVMDEKCSVSKDEKGNATYCVKFNL